MAGIGFSCCPCSEVIVIPRELVPMLVAGVMAMDSEESKVQQVGQREKVSIQKTETDCLHVKESAGRSATADSKLNVATFKDGTFAAYSISPAALLSDARCQPSQILSLDPVTRCEPGDLSRTDADQRAKSLPNEVFATDFGSLIPDEISAPVNYISTGIEDLRKQMLRQYVREKYLRRVSTR